MPTAKVFRGKQTCTFWCLEFFGECLLLVLPHTHICLFQVGMNPDWIMSDEALAAKRRRRNESSHTALEKLQKISPAPRKITPATGYPRVASVEPILIAANSADGLSMLANCASPAPPVQQQQFALLTTQPGGPKVITIVPVQQLQQSTTPLTQAKLDP